MVRNGSSFDHNLCVFCTSCVPKLVILETKNGHIGVHVTKNGRFVYQKWYTIVSYVPKLVILETKNGHIGVHVTKNGRFVYQKWYTIVSYVPKLVILETKNGL